MNSGPQCRGTTLGLLAAGLLAAAVGPGCIDPTQLHRIVFVGRLYQLHTEVTLDNRAEVVSVVLEVD